MSRSGGSEEPREAGGRVHMASGGRQSRGVSGRETARVGAPGSEREPRQTLILTDVTGFNPLPTFVLRGTLMFCG